MLDQPNTVPDEFKDPKGTNTRVVSASGGLMNTTSRKSGEAGLPPTAMPASGLPINTWFLGTLFLLDTKLSFGEHHSAALLEPLVLFTTAIFRETKIIASSYLFSSQ